VTTSRRGFLTAFRSAAKSAPKTTDTPSRRYILKDSYVGGFQNHEGPKLLAEMKVGDPLELVPEPTYIYDPYAVRVTYRGSHIGYIPREQNRTVSDLVKQGTPLECSITSVSTTGELWQAVRMQVSVAVTTPTP
jgi:hypothetical protein